MYGTDYYIDFISESLFTHELSLKLQGFEREFVYPFSDEYSFTICHGLNGRYFDFFMSLGELKLYIVYHRPTNDIAAVGAGILRTLANKTGRERRVWYICDVKVAKPHRGQHLFTKLAINAAWRAFQCSRGYAVCMNPSDGSEPTIKRIWNKYAIIPGAKSTQLTIFSLTYEELCHHLDMIESVLEEDGIIKQTESIQFRDNTGVKDIELVSSSDPSVCMGNWQILHLDYGPSRDGGGTIYADPVEGYTYLIAATNDSFLHYVLTRYDIKVGSTATIISRGMSNFNMNNILTSEI